MTEKGEHGGAKILGVQRLRGHPTLATGGEFALFWRTKFVNYSFLSALTGFPLALVLLPYPTFAVEPCRIEVVEKGSGWPVSLVELRTTHAVRFVTDNAGVIAFDLPELMGRETWFDVSGHGYDRPRDGFGC